MRGRLVAIRVAALLLAANCVVLAADFFRDGDSKALLVESWQGETVAVVLLVVGLAAAAGLLLLQRWAWVTAMAWVGVAMGGQLVAYFEDRDTSYAAMLLSVLFVFYFNRTEVQQVFLSRDCEGSEPR